MCYTVVENYYRQKAFDYYRQYRNPFYSMTFELDATRLKAFIGEHGYKTYLNLCYFLTRGAQGIEDFRYRLRDGRLVLYDSLHPGLTVPAAGGTYSWAHFEYDDDVHLFNRRAEANWPSSEAPAEMMPEEHDNQIYFTAIPGVAFNGFTHAWNDPAEGAMRVAFGMLFERDGKTRVSVGVQLNHVFVDGRALGELVSRAQQAFDDPEA